MIIIDNSFTVWYTVSFHSTTNKEYIMTDKPMIDLARDDLLTIFGKEVLKDRYMLPTEKSPQEALS